MGQIFKAENNITEATAVKLGICLDENNGPVNQEVTMRLKITIPTAVPEKQSGMSA